MDITKEQICAVSSLAELTDLVARCQRCPLFETKTKDVFGIGDPNAEIFFIGEAPGKNEDETGSLFVGTAGKYLDEMLTEIGLSRKQTYITNVLKHRPPANRDPHPNEIAACWPYLAIQIKLINPKLIVFLGRHAMHQFFPNYMISEVHGKAFEQEFNGKKQHFLALYHPMTARFGGMRKILINDFRKIPKILEKIEE